MTSNLFQVADEEQLWAVVSVCACPLASGTARPEPNRGPAPAGAVRAGRPAGRHSPVHCRSPRHAEVVRFLSLSFEVSFPSKGDIWVNYPKHSLCRIFFPVFKTVEL